MLNNYLKVIWRSLRRNPLYAGVSVAGLSLGLFCGLLACVYMRHELSYDHFSPADDRTYRLAVERIYPDHVVGLAAVPSSYARVIRQEVPGVESTVRLCPIPEGMTIKLGGINRKEAHVLAEADSVLDSVTRRLQMDHAATSGVDAAVLELASDLARYLRVKTAVE